MFKLTDEEKIHLPDLLAPQNRRLLYKMLSQCVEFQRQELVTTRVTDRDSGGELIRRSLRLNGAEKLLDRFIQETQPKETE